MNRTASAAFAGLSACLVASAAQADEFLCHGTAPKWELSLDPAQARFTFPAPTDMEVMLVTRPAGQDWPQAFTLIGDRDTAIVLLEQEACDDGSAYRAHVMTQRGQSPILLTGCCVLQE